MMVKGIGGEILWVDMTKSTIEKKPVEDEMVNDYLLGAGYLSRVLYDTIPTGIDPLSSKNVLGIATGLLTGSMFPQASRHVVAALSPLTDVWGESHAAGFWGLLALRALVFAGVMAVVFRLLSPLEHRRLPWWDAPVGPGRWSAVAGALVCAAGVALVLLAKNGLTGADGWTALGGFLTAAVAARISVGRR